MSASKSLVGPFVAVNGCTTVEHTKGITSAFASEFMIETHAPVLGFLVSFSTLNGSNTVRDSRYPKLKDLPALLRSKHHQFCSLRRLTLNPSPINSLTPVHSPIKTHPLKLIDHHTKPISDEKKITRQEVESIILVNMGESKLDGRVLMSVYRVTASL